MSKKVTKKNVDAEGVEAGQTLQDAGLVPGQYSAEGVFSPPGNISVPTSQQTKGHGHSVPRDVNPNSLYGVSSTNLDASRPLSPSLHDSSNYDETLRNGNRAQQGHTGGNGLSSKTGDRERTSRRDRQTKDHQPHRSDEAIPNKNTSGWQKKFSNLSNFLELKTSGDHYSYADEQNRRVEPQITSLKEENYRLGALNNGQAKTIDDLRAKLKILSADNQSIKQSANKMALAMESKDLFVGRQDSDDVVITRFGLLVGQIKTWSVPFADLEKSGTQIDLSGAKIQDIRRVMPGRSELLHTPKNVRLFVRGWVGLVVSNMLFRTLPSGQHHGSQGKDIWMDQEIALSFLQMEDRLFHADRKAITLRDLHDWRALTAGLVSRLHATSKIGKGMEGHVTGCSHVIMSLIGSWVNLDTRETLEKGLLGILLQAVEFSQILRCQRASWSVRHVDSALTTSDAGMVFNEAIMENKHGDDDSGDDDSMSRYQKLVEIIVSPGLFKRGNTDGERFEFESCVERAEVKCYRKPAKAHQ